MKLRSSRMSLIQRIVSLAVTTIAEQLAPLLQRRGTELTHDIWLRFKTSPTASGLPGYTLALAFNWAFEVIKSMVYPSRRDSLSSEKYTNFCSWLYDNKSDDSRKLSSYLTSKESLQLLDTSDMVMIAQQIDASPRRAHVLWSVWPQHKVHSIGWLQDMSQGSSSSKSSSQTCIVLLSMCLGIINEDKWRWDDWRWKFEMLKTWNERE